MNQEFVAKPHLQRKIIKRPQINQIPDEILNNLKLNLKIKKYLPENYNFEIHKIIFKIQQLNVKRVCLQFPEGLFIFSTCIADLIHEFTSSEAIIMGDVTYGACCVDDYVTSLNNCQLLIHFAHSCLIPLNEMVDGVKVLYIFVDIKFDILHCIETFKHNFPIEKYKDKHFAIASSIQFVSSVHSLSKELKNFGFNIHIPQAKPLSPGEVLGCTSPRLDKNIENVFFICDGRFHLEAMMIANPFIKFFYKYNPYDKNLTSEKYDQDKMLLNRKEAVNIAINLLTKEKDITFGFILGTLGHQGSVKVLTNLKNKLTSKYPNCNFINVLIPEINATLLNSFKDSVDVWLQISCPRLSIDWANDVINKPLLTPFELNVALEKNIQSLENYPMDFYESNSLGNWTPNHKCNISCNC